MAIKYPDYVVFNDDNIWEVGAFGGARHTSEIQGRGW